MAKTHCRRSFLEQLSLVSQMVETRMLRALADAVNGASGATGITAKVSADGSTLSLISNEGYDIVLGRL